VTDQELLAERFEEYRGHLRAVAYRMLGSPSEADDAVQEAWLRLSRSDATGIESLGGWLTTVVARVCLGMLRTRRSRREESLDPPSADASSRSATSPDPEDDALLADSVGLAMLVVLDMLSPAERVAFVLHDMFAVPFGEIAPILGRSSYAARQLASRGRRRVHGAGIVPVADLERQREVVDAFLGASRRGDFDALLMVLDPQIVLRADGTAVPGGATRKVHGATAVARGALAFSDRAQFAQPAIVDGTVGVIASRGFHVVVLAFAITNDGKISEIDIIADPTRVRELELAVLDA
jgi:RNA polymerase sigma factor (sigma-70 family)